MSLVDSDKNSDNRGTPSLNSNDDLNQRMSHETNGITYRTAGNDPLPNLLFKQGVIKSEDKNGLTNVFFGYDPAINTTRPILRVAKDGYDAQTANEDQLVFNSEQNVFKIVKTIIHDHSYSFGSHIGSGYTQDGVFDAVPHGLTYTPAMLVYATSSIDPVSRAMVATGSVYRLSNGSTADQTAFALTTYQYYCDGTNINVGLIRDCILGSGAGSGSIGAASGTINFTFYLLQETAS